MRILTLGIDEQGRSCVVGERAVAPAEVIPGVAVERLFSTTQSPPLAPPPGQGVYDEMTLEPGQVSWMVVDMAPYSDEDEPTIATAMHYNNTIELFCVLEGSVRTVLGAGVLELGPGDCVAMPGVDHATRAGAQGARVLSISIGLKMAR